MKTALSPQQDFSDYKVADIQLADWGRKEIALAEVEMPGAVNITDKTP